MTESETRPMPVDDVADDPRRLVLADLVGQLVAGVATRASQYEAAAAQGEGDLRQALEELARAKHAQAADLAPVARTLGVVTPSPPAPIAPGAPPAWGVILGEAFQDERLLEATARELARLTPEPALSRLATWLAAGAARDRETVRRLYLRYT